MAETGPGTDAAGTMPRIVETPGVLGGDPRLEGHRIGVFDIYRSFVDGAGSAEAIAESYAIEVAEVYAALSYGFANPEEMAAIDRRRQERQETLQPYRLTPDDGQ